MLGVVVRGLVISVRVGGDDVLAGAGRRTCAFGFEPLPWLRFWLALLLTNAEFGLTCGRFPLPRTFVETFGRLVPRFLLFEPFGLLVLVPALVTAFISAIFLAFRSRWPRLLLPR